MRYALCNEMFEQQPFDEAWPLAREIGYTGVEIAPFTLVPAAAAVDVRQVSQSRRQEVKQQAADAGLEVVGLHWLLAKTEGFYLTSPDAAVRSATAEYFKALAKETGIPYQNLINLYLRDCVASGKRPTLKWATE